MPDTTVLPTGGMSGGNSSGVNWLLVGGVGVGVVILLLMVSKSGKSAGQPTTSAGTSINAALGSVQEQNLNIMGELSQSEQTLSRQLDASTNQIVGGQVAQGTTTLDVANMTYGNLDIIRQYLKAIAAQNQTATGVAAPGVNTT